MRKPLPLCLPMHPSMVSLFLVSTVLILQLGIHAYYTDADPYIPDGGGAQWYNPTNNL